MRFVEFLKSTVLINGAAATLLAVITLGTATQASDNDVALVAAGWWFLAAVIGTLVGRREQVTTAIGRLLADAKAATSMPEHHPTAVMLNRLWPLLLATLAAAVLGVLSPRIPAVATGFAIIWALSWRKQHRAVQGVEERDGVVFFVEDTSPFGPMALKRMPGMRREVPSVNGGGAGGL
jgi:hypothetical protein